MTVAMPILAKKCLRVSCPKCGANVGVTCKLTGKSVDKNAPICHDERIALSEENPR